MVDNNNDEYEFADLDVSPDLMGEDDTLTSTNQPQSPATSEKQNVLRNAIIVVVLIILTMLLYKFVGSFFTKKAPPVESTTPVVPLSSQAKIPVVEEPVIVPTPAPIPVVTEPSNDNPQLNQKLATIDLNQQNIRSDVNNLTSQLGGIDSNITNLNTKIATLTQMVTALTTKLDQQSTQISMMMAARAKPVKVHKVVKRIIVPSTLYYIQAVIPGRAWLIASNGSTLTVREGSNIAGYGIVKLIDPNQGRVVTSSGRVIRFSQQDS